MNQSVLEEYLRRVYSAVLSNEELENLHPKLGQFLGILFINFYMNYLTKYFFIANQVLSITCWYDHKVIYVVLTLFYSYTVFYLLTVNYVCLVMIFKYNSV